VLERETYLAVIEEFRLKRSVDRPS